MNIWLCLTFSLVTQFYVQKNNINMVYIYATAFYFVVTNATTVGYGDYSATTIPEKCFAMILQFAGILMFSSITSKI